MDFFSLNPIAFLFHFVLSLNRKGHIDEIDFMGLFDLLWYLIERLDFQRLIEESSILMVDSFSRPSGTGKWSGHGFRWNCTWMASSKKERDGGLLILCEFQGINQTKRRLEHYWQSMKSELTIDNLEEAMHQWLCKHHLNLEREEGMRKKLEIDLPSLYLVSDTAERNIVRLSRSGISICLWYPNMYFVS